MSDFYEGIEVNRLFLSYGRDCQNKKTERKEMMTVITREELEEFLEAMWEERLKK